MLASWTEATGLHATISESFTVPAGSAVGTYTFTLTAGGGVYDSCPGFTDAGTPRVEFEVVAAAASPIAAPIAAGVGALLLVGAGTLVYRRKDEYVAA